MKADARHVSGGPSGRPGTLVDSITREPLAGARTQCVAADADHLTGAAKFRRSRAPSARRASRTWRVDEGDEGGQCTGRVRRRICRPTGQAGVPVRTAAVGALNDDARLAMEPGVVGPQPGSLGSRIPLGSDSSRRGRWALGGRSSRTPGLGRGALAVEGSAASPSWLPDRELRRRPVPVGVHELRAALIEARHEVVPGVDLDRVLLAEGEGTIEELLLEGVSRLPISTP